MSTRFLKLILLLAVVALVSWMFILNPGPVTVFFGGGRSWTAPGALILITVFCLGILLSAAVSLLLGFRYSYLVWRDKKRDKLALEHLRQIGHAREHLLVGDYSSAQATLKNILSAEPENIVARNMLSESLEAEGDLDAALKVLEEARPTQKTNQELLFRAAQIQTRLGNLTAAYDHYVLLLGAQPNNLAALSRLVECASKLGRNTEAVVYQTRVVKLHPEKSEKDRLAQLELAVAESTPSESDKKVAIEAVLKRHRDFPSALIALAQLEKRAGNLEAATKLYTKAYRDSGEPHLLEKLAFLWIEAENPSRAVSAISAAVKSYGSGNSIVGELFRAALYRHLEMYEESKRIIALLLNRPDATAEDQKRIRFFDALMTEREGRTAVALDTFKSILRDEKWCSSFPFLQGSSEEEVPWWRTTSERKIQPSPTLSTP